ncbi:hypothetical protein FRC01_004877 [Tulasnella sp. 417]|nr:hypothetical protein FRC01_004877 [Tulasnella sp. 417]
MIKFSYELRSNSSWWTKIKDPDTRSKWKAEALEHAVQGEKLTEAEVEWVLDELGDYNKMRDQATGIQPSCHVRIWESDELVSQDLRSRLISAAALLEIVPEDRKDWHPRSSGRVLDLVHPSLFCAVYGRTLFWDGSAGDRCLKIIGVPYKEMDGWAYSDQFCWIPTDFQLGENGAPAKALGYINNVHPENNKDLVGVIECLVGRFSLLWDKVLTDIHPEHHGKLPGRAKVTQRYEWIDDPEYPEPPRRLDEELGKEEYQKQYELWKENRVLKQPTVDERGYHGSGRDITSRDVTYSIQGKEVQIIVKLINIQLTPKNPAYAGGSWHVEGMANERIVASGIYYYDCENISESQLAFRVAVNSEEEQYEQSIGEGIGLIWGLDSSELNNQEVGSVKTSTGRCIAFPNIYQHKVSPFRLVDRTKPGHRKIVALFLVDPEERIPSTSDIPPQQSHWVREAIRETLMNEESGIKVALPVELADMVADRVGNLMTLEEAKYYREALMDERTGFVDLMDERYFYTAFSFCEH